MDSLQASRISGGNSATWRRQSDLLPDAAGGNDCAGAVFEAAANAAYR